MKKVMLKIARWAIKRRFRKINKQVRKISILIDYLKEHHIVNGEKSEEITNEQWFLNEIDKLNLFTVQW